MMKIFWFSAYDQFGNQFGTTVIAENITVAFKEFYSSNPNCGIADYGYYDF